MNPFLKIPDGKCWDFYEKRRVLPKELKPMNLFREIKNYQPQNQQEERDKEQMLRYMETHPNYLERTDQIAHFSASVWTINKEHQKP